jgi:hypothetical protein
MKTIRLIGSALLAVLLLAAPLPVDAASPTDEATAATLFKEAIELAKAGDNARALPKFQEAQRLFPTVGTALNIGIVSEKLGRLATAYSAYKQAEIMARNKGDGSLEAEAVKRAKAIEGSLSRLAITVAPAARVAGLTVKRDGSDVNEAQWGSAVPVDAGEHTIEATAPGKRPWSKVVTVGANGATGSVEVPALEEAPIERPPSWWTPQRIAGVSVGSVGVVGVVVGAIFGARAITKYGESKQQCSPKDPNFCTDAGLALRKETKTAGTVSTIALAAGGAAVAGGVVLVLTAKTPRPKDTARIELAPGTALGDMGLTIRGRW